ncbi:MAG: alpha/beta hydrolase [Kiritimatiellae bacterium]|nr:alpha/beta hydrolase [Kiritimatiellia bacterium]
MKTAGIAIVGSMLVIAASHAQSNLVINGDFEKTTEPWYGQKQDIQKVVRAPEMIAHETKDTPDKSAGALKVTIKKDANCFYRSHGAGAICNLSEVIPADKSAKVIFWAKSLSGPKVLSVHRLSGGGSDTVLIEEKWKKHEITLCLPFDTGAFVFSLVPRSVPGIQELTEGEFLLDNVSVLVWGLPEPTLTNVSYGPHERQVLDFWRAPVSNPAPVLVFIHGGGWLHGDKGPNAGFRATVDKLHKHGVSVASINYRYSTQAPLPAPVHDAARAIQFLRSKASELGIDKTRIAAYGGSAGGCTALWLATHHDLADPQSADPVARESTRLCGAVALSAQTTIDPVVIRRDVYETAINHAMICRSAGFANNKAMDAGYEKAAALYREFSPINHLSADDPPTLLRYTGPVTDPKEGIHSSRFGVIFKKRADEVGVPCHIKIQKNPDMYPKPPDMWDFLFEVMKADMTEGKKLNKELK